MRNAGSRASFDVKKFLAGAFCAVVLSALVFAVWLALGFADVASDVKPAGWESATMTPAVHAAVRRSAQPLRNPLPVSEAGLIAGGKLYMNDCIGCHGEPGKPSEFGLTFFPPAPQLWQDATRYRDTEVFWIAKHGLRWTGMDPQSPGYSDPDLWRLGMFISRIGNLPPAILKAIQPTPK